MLTILSVKPDMVSKHIFTHTHIQHKYQNKNNCLQFFNFSKPKIHIYFLYFDIRMRFLIKIYNKSK